MKVGYLFSVPLAEFRLEQHESLDQELAELFLARESEGDKYRDPIRRDTQHGAVFESRFNVFDWPDPPVRQLAAFVHTSLASVVNTLSDYTPEEFARLVFRYDAWFHVTRKGGYQGLHKHENASWSGIYCVDPGDDVPDRPDSGVVRFHDPRSNANYYIDAGNKRMKLPVHYGSYQIEHEAGKLLIFPSYLTHEIFPYIGDRPRIVVAFNAMVEYQPGDTPQDRSDSE